MADKSHHVFASTKLDPDLLSTPFEKQTNWHVITGAPSCGKSTLINLLAGNGFQTVPEGARQYMESEIARGRTIDEIRANATDLQRIIKDIQLATESILKPLDVVFLDGAIPSSLAWYRVFGLNPNKILPECFHHRYDSIFILSQLPLQLNGLRFKDETLIAFLDEWHVRDYNSLGYNVIRVPILTPEERLAFVLENLSERGVL